MLSRSSFSHSPLRPTYGIPCTARPRAAQPKDLAAHAAAIRDILATEAAKHRDVALAYANEKLPGLKVWYAARGEGWGPHLSKGTAC